MNSIYTNLLIAVLSITFFSGCSSTKVKMLNGAQKNELSPSIPVKVFAESEPSFRYKKICEIKIDINSPFAGTQLSDYSNRVKKEARSCGTRFAIVESLSGLSYGSGDKNLTIYGYGIEKISETQSLDKNDIQKLILATEAGNISALKTILSKSPRKHESRASFDQNLLSLALYRSVGSQKSCVQNSIDFLVKSYDAQILEPGKYDLYSLENVFECPGIIENSFQSYPNREALFIAFNNYFMRNPQKKSRLKSLYPLFQNEIRSSCASDTMSKMCVLKTQLAKIKTLL